MILDVTTFTLSEIQDPALREYAGMYTHIYEDFMDQIKQMGMEIEEQDDSQENVGRIRLLKAKGVDVRSDGKSVVLNHMSPGCQACQTSIGSITFFVTLKCHRDCFFCFNPNQQDYQYHLSHTRDLQAELDTLRASGQRVLHLALTGGEPLLHKEETKKFFQHARRNFPNAYTRLYTCGDHLEPEILKSLKDARLDEIRFSIRLHDTPNALQYTYNQIALASEYIPNVMVEMPVLPGAFEEMKAILIRLDELGVFGINLLELCFPYNNASIFRERGYRIKSRPFRVLYDYWYAGGLPVSGSEKTCLELIEFALEAGLKLGVHYCSLENKHTGQVYQQNMKRIQSDLLYFSQKDYFLKSAKIFGENIENVRQIFEKHGYRNFRFDEQHGLLEFHVSRIKLLTKLDIEVGISTNVIELRNGQPVLRELKVDVTTPQSFRLSKDI